MIRSQTLFIVLALNLLACADPAATAGDDPGDQANEIAPTNLVRIEISPKDFVLTGSRENLQLVVTGYTAEGDTVDLTHIAECTVLNPKVASVSSSGQLKPQADGIAEVEVNAGGTTQRVRVEVRGQKTPQPMTFEYDALPALAKAGCSGGACHGSPNGKAGFRLSLFGFDPEFDRGALVRDARSRRVNTVDPGQSLLLRKATMDVPHAGGRRLRPGDSLYSVLHQWIGEGCRVEPVSAKCIGIEVEPSVTRVLRFPAATQQFRVQARFDDGSVRDVTHLSQFTLSDPDVASVTSGGLVTGLQRGETAVIARYLEHIETPLLTFVEDVPGFEWSAPPAINFVDTHVDRKLRQLQYLSSGVCSDEAFLRRVFLDVIGTLPTPDEADQFLASDSPKKRSELIDELVERPEYALFWAQKWGDLLRVSRKQIGLTSVFKFHGWLHGAVATNLPYDEFATQLLTASGSTFENPAGNYYRTSAETLDAMETSAQLFLGTRIQCAKCHNHPFERWTQDDYFGLAAFFNRVQRNKVGQAEEVVLVSTQAGEVTHPANGRVMQPWVPVDGQLSVDARQDRRAVFAAWLTSPDNPYFARVEVNRIWAQVMGRGIVEPFDDFRDSNPPANAPLLDALADEFVASGFDRKHILKVILNSRTYQTDSRPNDFNRGDDRYFSHYYTRRLTAEQLVDAVGVVTGSPERFEFVAPETKATWLPAPDLKPHDRAKIGEIDFLKVFGQPERQSVCECDRGDDTSLGQALELLNGKFINRQLTTPGNLLHKQLEAGRPLKDIVIDIYRRALTRRPTDRELQASVSYLASRTDRGQALEDVCWAVVNKNEFLFQH